MHPLIRQSVKKLKLTYLWFTRILGAQNHNDVSFGTKLDMNLRGGYLADQYVMYDLENNDRSQYLSEFDWYRSRWINEPFDPMLNNKVVATEVLKHVASVPEILVIKNKGRIFDYGAPATFASTDDALKAVDSAGSVFMKPIGMGKGRGIHRIDAPVQSQVGNAQTGAPSWEIDGKAASKEHVIDLLDRSDGWLLCETIKQHSQLARIFPDSSNTVRVITLREPTDGSFKVFFGVLRLGTKATVPVDNGSRGGLVAKIDLADGSLSSARTLWSDVIHEVHPDTGAQISGTVVPGWEDIKTEALRLARLFPYLQFVAWDILMTDTGPCVIEANTSSGINIIQLWGPQRRGELGDFYRAHGVIR